MPTKGNPAGADELAGIKKGGIQDEKMSIDLGGL